MIVSAGVEGSPGAQPVSAQGANALDGRLALAATLVVVLIPQFQPAGPGERPPVRILRNLGLAICGGFLACHLPSENRERVLGA